MAEAKMHKIEISTCAARMLYLYLSQPGIFSKPQDFFQAGLLLAGILDPVRKAPTADPEKEEDKFKEWADAPFPPFEIPESQRDSVKSGLQEVAKKGILQVSKYTNEILLAFGLTQ